MVVTCSDIVAIKTVVVTDVVVVLVLTIAVVTINREKVVIMYT